MITGRLFKTYERRNVSAVSSERGTRGHSIFVIDFQSPG